MVFLQKSSILLPWLFASALSAVANGAELASPQLSTPRSKHDTGYAGMAHSSNGRLAFSKWIAWTVSSQETAGRSTSHLSSSVEKFSRQEFSLVHTASTMLNGTTSTLVSPCGLMAFPSQLAFESGAWHGDWKASAETNMWEKSETIDYTDIHWLLVLLWFHRTEPKLRAKPSHAHPIEAKLSAKQHLVSWDQKDQLRRCTRSKNSCFIFFYNGFSKLHLADSLLASSPVWNSCPRLPCRTVSVSEVFHNRHDVIVFLTVKETWTDIRLWRFLFTTNHQTWYTGSSHSFNSNRT